MRVLVLNAIPQADPWQAFEAELEASLKTNHEDEIAYYKLRDMDIKYCTGCWTCWWKTPGQCAIKDDYLDVLKRIPKADQILYVAPIIAGYESSLLKKCKDRSIPNALPYIRLYKGEQHHYQRYGTSPDIRCLFINDGDTTKEELETLEWTYKRMALNFGSQLIQFKPLEKKGDLSYALSHL